MVDKMDGGRELVVEIAFYILHYIYSNNHIPAVELVYGLCWMLKKK